MRPRRGVERATGLWTEYGLVVKALAAALVLVGLKGVVAWFDLEFVSTIAVLTGLMGAVVFTLAILLAGVLADFKESEKIVTELVAELDRLDRDLPLAIREEGALARAKGNVRDLVTKVHDSLRVGTSVHMREVKAPLHALDLELDRISAAGGPPNYIIFVRQHMAAVSRMAYRLESIIETSFVASAYAIAGAVVSVALGVFAVTDIEPLPQAMLLYGFGAFLLIALFLLIQDLDNPFAGHARVDLRPLAKLEASMVPVEGTTKNTTNTKTVVPVTHR